MTRTAGYRHASIEAGIEAITAIGRWHALAVDATEDPSMFETAMLDRYAVVVFLNTTGNILNERQQAALRSFVGRGGGFVGIHSATDTEHGWPWYGKLVGARFAGHGPVEQATVRVTDRGHASTRHLPAEWVRHDEWYTFGDLACGLHVLAEVRDATAPTRPIAWCHDVDGGRSWYTGGGHTAESFDETLFREHVAGGILWAAEGTKARRHGGTK